GKICSFDQNKLCIRTRFWRIAEHLISGLEVRNAFTHSSYTACYVTTWRPGELQREDLAQKPLAASRINTIHAGEVVFHQYLSRPRRWNWNFVDVERCSIVINTYCFHFFLLLI